MVHRKLIGPALAATAFAVLAFGGVTGAQGPIRTGLDLTAAPAAAEFCAEESIGPDTDNIQEGDQTTPDEVTGPEPDTLQEGDQTTPDEACPTAASAADAAAVSAVIASAANAAGPDMPNEAAGESAGESSGESDGPGGHEDTGANADHQFEGVE